MKTLQQLPPATMRLLRGKGAAVTDADITRALKGTPVSAKDLRALREGLLDLAGQATEQVARRQGNKRGSTSKQADTTFGGTSSAASPAHARLKISPADQRKAKQLAEGGFLTFLWRRELPATALQGPLLQAALAEQNTRIRTTSGEPAYSEAAGKMAAALLVTRQFQGPTGAPLPERKVLDAMQRDPRKTFAALGRVLSHVWPVPTGDGFTATIHVFIRHRSFQDGALQLVERLLAGDKLDDKALNAAVTGLCEQTTKEYQRLLASPHDFTQHEELCAPRSRSEPKRTGFAHALAMLDVLSITFSESPAQLLGNPVVAKALARAAADMTGRPDYDRARYDQLAEEVRA